MSWTPHNSWDDIAVGVSVTLHITVKNVHISQKVWELAFPNIRAVWTVWTVQPHCHTLARRLNCADNAACQNVTTPAIPPARQFWRTLPYHLLALFHVSPSYNMDLATLSARIAANHSLQLIPFDCLLLFLALITAIKSDIALIQPSDHPVAATAKILPHSAQVFLSDACGLSINTIVQCWSAFKDLAWCRDETRALLQASPSTFHVHGIPHGFSVYMLISRHM